MQLVTYMTLLSHSLMVCFASLLRLRNTSYLAKLFDKAVICNFTISFKKSHFFREEVTFLGHILKKDGIRPHLDKISVILNFKEPKNIPQLQSFLGFLNFFADFFKHYAHETIPLLSFLKKQLITFGTRIRKKCSNDSN